jgi:hypothetical protein
LRLKKYIYLRLTFYILNLVLLSNRKDSLSSHNKAMNRSGFHQNYYNIVQQYYMFHSRFNFKEFYYNYFTITKIKVKIVKPLNYYNGKFRYHYNRDTLNRKR